MKKLLFLSLFNSFALFSFAQANLEPQKESTVYCDVVSRQVLFSFTGKVKVDIDFGQSQKFIRGINYNALRDEDGKPIVFNSIVDALNYMSADGWNLINTYTVTSQDTKELQVHYIMTKTVSQN